MVTVGIADVNTVAQALTVTGPGVGAVLAYAVVAVVLFTISPLLAALVLGGVPLLAIAVGPFLRRIEHTGGEYRAYQGRLTTRLVDVLAGLRVLNGLDGKAFVAERYEQQSQGLVDRGYRVAGPSSWVGALSSGLPALFLAAVVWLSARMAAVGDITIGDLVAVYGYVAVLVVPVASFIEGGGDIARARVAGQRIIDLLSLPVVRHNDDDPATIPAGCGPLADPDSGVIVRPGVFTALVAARPAEAITVIERLGHLSTDSEAGVTWAGVRIHDVAREEFRQRLVVADNHAEVFAGTVRDVVAGRLEPDDDRIRAAIRTAVAEDVVEALPGGLDATIAAGGSDLSGGQRQRIQLARAVYSTPDVLLAVDPTSAVDANTEAAMIDRLREARRGTTTVVTTASPLVLDRADEVIVLIDAALRQSEPMQNFCGSDPDYRDLVSRAQEDTEGDEVGRQMPVAGPAEVRTAAIGDLGADRRAVVGVILVNGLASAAGLTGPWLLGRIIDTIQAGSGDVLSTVDRLAFGALVLTIVQTVLTWWALKIGYRFGERTAARVRERFLQRTLALPPRVADHLPAGDLISRGSTDASLVAMTLRSAVPEVLVAVVHALFLIVAVLVLDPWLGLCGLVCLIGVGAAVRWYLRRARPAYLAVAASGAELADVVASTAKGARTIELLGLEHRRTQVTRSRYHSSPVRTARCIVAANGAVSVVGNCAGTTGGRRPGHRRWPLCQRSGQLGNGGDGDGLPTPTRRPTRHADALDRTAARSRSLLRPRRRAS